ncbi:sigma-70 family RNA polymerase sigma factor [Alteraurantiacibacter aquimixticola]|uniref:Sigma-70 family RNA polymerase sigma factor n=1 Tax=Alteraurantiacibacter aquimixticola TaxID=2489173 RepID=A0A4T3F2M2_9SPHN|nr:sigma-70 family RNA polymerase sigma factor [Alteraurantiacibacter aquimixticola]TIX51505.1 sigma-70 family RNA polymerase sigma factor [Alteraurantiacibacter aquimixticola]
MKHDHSNFSAAAAYRAQDIVADRVKRFVPMVRKAAWHIHGVGRDGLEIEDLMQAGFIALTECARNHEGPGEDGFAAYAKIRVRGAMFDLIRKQMPDSRNAVKRRRQAAEARDSLRQQLGREPTREELAEQLAIPVGELDQYLSEEIQLVSMETSYDDSSSAFASDLPDPFAVLCELQDNERLGEAMEALPDRLKLVLQLYFVEELNLTEIAQVLEVSVPRVHQLKAQALVKLKDLMAREDSW